MKRKEYEKPKMKVVKLQQQAPLLQASAGVQDYYWNTPEQE